MKVRRTLEEIIARRPVHLTLIDPDKQEPGRAGEIAGVAEQLGTDGFLVGGSSGISQLNLSATVEALKAATAKPVIFFPGQDKAYSMLFDAVFFLSLLNSRDVRYVFRAQAQSAMLLKKLAVETLAVGYLIVAPGMRVGQVGEADLLSREDHWSACGYGVAAEMMGMSYLYLECGSGSPVTVPAGMVEAVKKNVDIPIIVGGGIRTAEAAGRMLDAGADILVTGTVVESDEYPRRLAGIISKVHRG
jgi:phosphoglycerol geranylgeranyltransferase